MSTREHIGDLIRERRLALGFSLGQLATKLGKTPAVVRAWERGEDSPDQTLTAALIEALDLDASELEGLVARPEIELATPEIAAEPEPDAAADAGPATPGADAVVSDDADPIAEPVAIEVTDAAATAPSVAADHESLDVEESAMIEGGTEPELADAEPEALTSDLIIEHATVIPAVGPAVDEPTEAMPAPVATMAPPETEPGGYDVIDPVVAETPARPPITVPPLRLPNPIRLLFDPHHRYLYWIRYALTLVVLFILVRVFVWAGGELWTALGDFLDTFRATDGEEDQALRFILGV